MDYDYSKNKLRKIWNDQEELYAETDLLKIGNIPVRNIYYQKGIQKYVIETPIPINRTYSVNLSLQNFPESFLPYIKFIPIVSTMQPYESSDILTTYEYDLLPNNQTQLNRIYLNSITSIVYRLSPELDNQEQSYNIYGYIYLRLTKRISLTNTLNLPVFLKMFLYLYNLGDNNEIRGNQT